MADIADSPSIHIVKDDHRGVFELTESLKLQFERIMEREWPGVAWNDADGATLRLPFCRASETMDKSGHDTIFVIGMKRTYVDGRRTSDALCTRVHFHQVNTGTTLDVYELGGAPMRLLYCEVLRLIAWLHPTLKAELARCEALLVTEQAQATTPKAEISDEELIQLHRNTQLSIQEILDKGFISKTELYRRLQPYFENGTLERRGSRNRPKHGT